MLDNTFLKNQEPFSIFNQLTYFKAKNENKINFN